jgi:hypothetical protein
MRLNENIFAPADASKSRSDSSEVKQQKSHDLKTKPTRPEQENSEAKVSFEADAEPKDDAKMSKMKSNRFSQGDKPAYAPYEDLKDVEAEELEQEEKENESAVCCYFSGDCRICGVKVRRSSSSSILCFNLFLIFIYICSWTLCQD